MADFPPPSPNIVSLANSHMCVSICWKKPRAQPVLLFDKGNRDAECRKQLAPTWVSGSAENRHDSPLAGRAKPQFQQALPHPKCHQRSPGSRTVHPGGTALCVQVMQPHSHPDSTPPRVTWLEEGLRAHVTQSTARTIWPSLEPTRSPCVNIARHLEKQNYIFHNEEINL